MACGSTEPWMSMSIVQQPSKLTAHGPDLSPMSLGARNPRDQDAGRVEMVASSLPVPRSQLTGTEGVHHWGGLIQQMESLGSL